MNTKNTFRGYAIEERKGIWYYVDNEFGYGKCATKHRILKINY